MFALTEIVKDKLYALANSDGSDAFNQCFEQWQDVSWLYNFFKANPEAFGFYGVDLKTAVQLIMKERDAFFDDILEIAEGRADAKSLDDIVFQPLHDGDDLDLPLVETKAYGYESKPSFLRLYAIRLSDGAYIVVGGLIKTTQSLQQCDEGRDILRKLKWLVKMLRKSQSFDSFDIGVFIA